MVKLIFGLGIGAIAYIGFGLSLWLGQTRLIFYPQPAPLTTPAEAGLPYEDVWIPVGNGQIHGWWLPSTDPNAKTVLMFHGNASNVEDTLIQAQPFLALGLSVLLIDYRGYGLSSGPFPNEKRVYEDAIAAWDYLTQTREISADDIVIFGHSIGGAIAIELASQQPAAAGLIVQATFTSMMDMMDHAGYSRLVPKWLLNQHFASIDKVQSLQMPVLLIHGMNDRTVPAGMSQTLHGAIAAPKQLWLVPIADHNDIAIVAGEPYTLTIHDWLQTLTDEKPAGHRQPI